MPVIRIPKLLGGLVSSWNEDVCAAGATELDGAFTVSDLVFTIK